MRKVLRITFIVLAFILSSLGILYYFFGIFTPYNYFTARRDIENNRPQLIRYGKRPYSDKQAKIIAHRLGFYYCSMLPNYSVTPPLQRGIEIYNNTIIKYLNARLGENWKQKFDFKIDSLFREQRVDTIRKIVLGLSKVKRLSHYIDSSNNKGGKLFIWVLPQKKNGANVRVAQKLPDSTIAVYAYYHIDPYTLKISAMSY